MRRPGAGRKRAAVVDPQLKGDLERLFEPTTPEDPQSPLRWTCRRVRRLARELNESGQAASYRMVARLLHELVYSLPAKSRTIEGARDPDRNLQFEYLRGSHGS